MEKRDEQGNREMGDGDIIIPLPPHMTDTKYDHTGRSDGQNAVTIIEEIAHRLSAYSKPASAEQPTDEGLSANALLRLLVGKLSSMEDQERLEIFEALTQGYCKNCGRDDSHSSRDCQCDNDT